MPADRDQRRSSHACLECRLAKTKCLVQPSKSLCERCERFHFDCKFVRHHRGRKPVSKLASEDSPSPPPQRQELDNASRKRIWDMLASKIPQSGSTYMFVNKGEVALDGETIKPESTIDAGGNTFRNLLRPVSGQAGSSEAKFPRLPDTISLSGPKDPCDLGILTVGAAKRLLDYYFTHLNPWAFIFDPALTSQQSIRTSSSILYTVILFLASRYIELQPDEAWYSGSLLTPALSSRLGTHVRSLAVQSFALGDRALETATAFYLFSVWKEADDAFSFLYCSFAGKIMSDIPSDLLSSSDSHQRNRRYSQRAFLFYFVQEHAQMLHFAPRPNFDRGPSLLRNLLAWSDDELATEDDLVLCADIDSLLLQTKYKSIMEKAQRESIYAGADCFLLLETFIEEVQAWSSKWEAQARRISQRFADKPNKWPSLSLSDRLTLFKVFRHSLVMQISSIAFRASLRARNQKGDKVDERTEAVFYTCLEAALGLLHHTTLMELSVLRHAQDLIMVLSPHAALLATYLISLPSTRDKRRRENETRCLSLLRSTRDAFRAATVRAEDNVAICWHYIDSLLQVIEGDSVDDSGVDAAQTLLQIGAEAQAPAFVPVLPQGTGTAVDWGWLQSFMELPEFSWM